MSVFDKINTHYLFNQTIDKLTFNQFFKKNSIRQKQHKIPLCDLKKCIWLCSILANSKDENHRKKAQLFTALIYLQNDRNIDIERVCYLLMSRTGNLAAARLLPNFPKNFTQSDNFLYNNFDAILNLELAQEWNDKVINIQDENFIASKFQRDLWNKLTLNQGIAISAPTSAGKSFIIKKYIKQRLQESTQYSALYVVPSRALLNQVSEEFRTDVGDPDVDIKTAYIEKERTNQKNIYTLTPERCLRLIQNIKKDKIKIDLIFIDEIQNLENEDGRGSILEYVIKELSQIYPKSQIVIAGPNIRNTENLYKGIFGRASQVVETSVSPVFQLRTIVSPAGNNQIKITLKNLAGEEQEVQVKTDFDLNRRLKKNYADGLIDVINLFAKNEQNIIYSPRTDYVETWALKYASNLNNKRNTRSKELDELVEFLQEEIHPQYSLVKCLQKQVAFHHSKLPDIVRKEIEDGFLETRIKNLFCTSTLLEGVNLPANNLFVVSPKKLNSDLSPFEFGNLIGRAGRIKDSLYGTIYCIERDKSGEWANLYYDQAYEKEVTTVTDKALQDFDSFLESLKKNVGEIESAKEENTVILMRHKYLRDSQELIKYLNEKQITTQKINSIIKILKSSLRNISIPIEILKLNPSIDPILQNKLYKEIQKAGIDKWTITPNSNFYSRISESKNSSIEFSETNFYWQLVSVMERLDKIFAINKETYFKHQITLSIKQICLYGTQWLNNISYSELIRRDIDFHSRHLNSKKRIDPSSEKDINDRINEVIKINTTIVTYVLAKYIKLLNDTLNLMMTDKQKEKYKFSLALPIMLELGTSEPIIIQLISRGVSRTVALKVFNEFKKTPNYKTIDIFYWLSTKQKLNLKPIYNRYLRKMKLLIQG